MTQNKKIFELFSKDASYEAYEYFEDNASVRLLEKTQFLANGIRVPKLLYPKLKDFDFASRRESLQKILSLLKEEGESLYNTLFTKRVYEKLAELHLMEAAKEGDMKKFLENNAPVSTTTFEQVVAEITTEITKYANNNADIGIIARALLEKLPKVQGKNYFPSTEVIQWVKGQFDQILAPLYKGIAIDSDQEYNALEIQRYFQKALENINAADTFQVVISENSKTAISVSQERREIIVPLTRKVRGKKLVQLIGHEIGIHVQRRIHGEQTPFPLLGLGLDGYLPAEEGLTTAWEQAVEGKVTSYGRPEAYLAIGSALGLDGIERDFREVFEILYHMYLFESLKKGGTISEKSEKAQSDAWNRCVRTFRGTDCSKGVAYTKDVCYRDGNIKIWQYLSKKFESGEDLPNLICGKFDPTKREHCDLVAML